MKKLTYPALNRLEFAVCDSNYVTLRDLQYQDIVVPKGFMFDGVTVKAPFIFIFSNKDLRQGIRASCFHDFMCQNKEKYSRKQATDLLVEIWKQDGLESFKSWIVRFSVNFYQWLKGWK